MPDPDWPSILKRIQRRYAELEKDERRSSSFMSHVVNLATWEKEGNEYPDIEAFFPEEVFVAYAVCQADCGVQELIVDGSTQECQKCGRHMFRIESRKYQIS